MRHGQLEVRRCRPLLQHSMRIEDTAAPNAQHQVWRIPSLGFLIEKLLGIAACNFSVLDFDTCPAASVMDVAGNPHRQVDKYAPLSTCTHRLYVPAAMEFI